MRLVPTARSVYSDMRYIVKQYELCDLFNSEAGM